MFQVCNGCRKHTKDLKMTNRVEEHCTTMKSIMDDLIEMSESEEILKLKREITYSHQEEMNNE